MFVLALALPLAAAGFEDALQELFASLVAAAFATGEFGFGFDEATFDGGFEDGGFVALEVGLDALQAGDGFVEGLRGFGLCRAAPMISEQRSISQSGTPI